MVLVSLTRKHFKLHQQAKLNMKYMELHNKDCFEAMKNIDDGSIDFILTDPPYGTTTCRWDEIIPMDKMWGELKRIIKKNGCIALFGTEPFSSLLRTSNIKWFKYDWVWQKDKATNHLNAKKMPMRRNELISIFYNKQCKYNPQLIDKEEKNIRPATVARGQTAVYGAMTKKSTRAIPINKSYPNETLQFRGCFGDKGKSFHPTQKPVDLLEYLIKTYTDEGEVVLDFTMGSGSTGIACINTNRNFIGIEKDSEFFKTAEHRLSNS